MTELIGTAGVWIIGGAAVLFLFRQQVKEAITAWRHRQTIRAFRRQRRREASARRRGLGRP